MKRRLYFLLPDVARTRSVVADLEANGIARGRMHVIAAPDTDIGDLPAASRNQRADLGERLEILLWDGNLVAFFLALAALLAMVFTDVNPYWLLVPAVVMLGTFAAGLEFTRHVPSVHLSDFADAMRHRELLLLVDVSASQTARVEKLVRHHHPEAVTGGVGWHVDALGV